MDLKSSTVLLLRLLTASSLLLGFVAASVIGTSGLVSGGFTTVSRSCSVSQALLAGYALGMSAVGITCEVSPLGFEFVLRRLCPLLGEIPTLVERSRVLLQRSPPCIRRPLPTRRVLQPNHCVHQLQPRRHRMFECWSISGGPCQVVSFSHIGWSEFLNHEVQFMVAAGARHFTRNARKSFIE